MLLPEWAVLLHGWAVLLHGWAVLLHGWAVLLPGKVVLHVLPPFSVEYVPGLFQDTGGQQTGEIKIEFFE